MENKNENMLIISGNWKNFIGKKPLLVHMIFSISMLFLSIAIYHNLLTNFDNYNMISYSDKLWPLFEKIDMHIIPELLLGVFLLIAFVQIFRSPVKTVMTMNTLTFFMNINSLIFLLLPLSAVPEPTNDMIYAAGLQLMYPGIIYIMSLLSNGLFKKILTFGVFILSALLFAEQSISIIGVILSLLFAFMSYSISIRINRNVYIRENL